MPEDLREASRAPPAPAACSTPPVALPSLITGSLTAWGQEFGTRSRRESVTAAGRTYSVKGVGTLLDQATYVRGCVEMITIVIVSMVTTVLLLNRAVCGSGSPLRSMPSP